MTPALAVVRAASPRPPRYHARSCPSFCAGFVWTLPTVHLNVQARHWHSQMVRGCSARPPSHQHRYCTLCGLGHHTRPSRPRHIHAYHDCDLGPHYRAYGVQYHARRYRRFPRLFCPFSRFSHLAAASPYVPPCACASAASPAGDLFLPFCSHRGLTGSRVRTTHSAPQSPFLDALR
jgi:hypothetical protein